MSEMTKDEVNASLFDECKRLQTKLTRMERQVKSGKAVAVKYHALLLAVETKTQGETRHETALRYIRQSEQGNAIARSGGDDVGDKYEH